MFFTIVAHPNQVPKSGANQGFLILDQWDDWGKFQTQFQLVIFDHDGLKFIPGDVKIGERGLEGASSPNIKPGFRAPTLEKEFDALDDRHFSLGANETYYETLNRLPIELRETVLTRLNDCAFDLRRFDSVLSEPVTLDSLLRDISVANVRNRYHRLTLGDARLTEFWFEYSFPSTADSSQPGPILNFHVKPDSEPPTNVHVLIGRNGVGKTWCLQHIARTLLKPEVNFGELRRLGDNWKQWSFAGLVFVSFSAFDNFELPDAERNEIHSEMVSLRAKATVDGRAESAAKTPAQLAQDFRISFEKCREGLKATRWQAAIRTLENDPLFAEAEIPSLLTLTGDNLEGEAERLFLRMSSGHAIVLLTITRLIDLVDERTLVLLEEPEGHLHPPLLSAFIRAVADLLIKRNGVAIIATHSPVVLQEVPKSCVTVLRRAGSVSMAERPSIETFGENVGILTREVFGLEVTTAGFHQMLRNAVEVERLNYQGVVDRFSGQLGAEARAITSALIANRDASEPKGL